MHLPRVQGRAGKGQCDGGGNTCAGIIGPFPACSPCPCPMNGQHCAGNIPCPSLFSPFQLCHFLLQLSNATTLGQVQVFFLMGEVRAHKLESLGNV